MHGEAPVTPVTPSFNIEHHYCPVKTRNDHLVNVTTWFIWDRVPSRISNRHHPQIGASCIPRWVCAQL